MPSLTISIFSLTPVSPIHLEFSLYPKYSPSAKLQGNRRFSSRGCLKKALPMLNWRRTRSSSMPVFTTDQKPTRLMASYRSAARACLPPGSSNLERSSLGSSAHSRSSDVGWGRDHCLMSTFFWTTGAR